MMDLFSDYILTLKATKEPAYRNAKLHGPGTLYPLLASDSPMEFVEGIQAACHAHALRQQTEGDREHKPALLPWAADIRTLRQMLREIRAHGGTAPGVDGRRPADVTDRDLRAISESMRQGTYAPHALRECRIPKRSGGTRTLQIPTIDDRIVERALLTILEPIMEPVFHDTIHGFRPGRSPHTALAQAIRLTEAEGRWVWGAYDLEDAFGSIPHGRMLQVLNRHIPDEEMMRMTARFVTRDGTKVEGAHRGRGVPQGCPLSPFFLNMYAAQHLDEPSAEQNPQTPMIRYADDLLTLCRSRAELRRAEGSLKKISRPHGLRPNARKTKKTDLKGGEQATYMGFSLGSV